MKDEKNRRSALRRANEYEDEAGRQRNKSPPAPLFQRGEWCAGGGVVIRHPSAGLTMPGLVLHLGATVMCAHAGQATPTTPFPRVMVSGQPVVTMASPYTVAGCTMPPPNAGNGPCVMGQWTTAATRVLAGGAPVLINTGSSVCTPTGTPLMATVTQTRVTAM